ncbi:MAG: pyridoxamine kinase [Clostridiales bacterium]|nr:pyridoxamine kinase [Clostridiales bacterium]
MSVLKKVAAIHDISGIGRCSLSVILPTLSVMGIQACAVPTAVLSAHTGGFGDVEMRDLTDYIIPCFEHYHTQGIEFDAIYSGFLASKAQIDGCLAFFEGNKGALKIVDPVLGDGGKAYRTITPCIIDAMKKLVKYADVITPNLTEAAILLGEDFPHELSVQQAKSWLVRLSDNAETVVITSVPLLEGKISNLGYDKRNSAFWRVDCDFVPIHYPGTGDIFASILTGSLMKGESLPIAINRATAFTQIAVKTTYSYGTPAREGVLFEKVVGWLNSDVTLSDFSKL